MEKFMTIHRMIRKIILFFSLFLILAVPPSYAQELKKIMAMPFEVYSNQDTKMIRESLYNRLSTELRKEQSVQILGADNLLKNDIKMEDDKALEIGRKMQADFVITGSLVHFGDAVNIDARIIDVGQGSVLLTTSVQGKGLANLGPAVEQLKAEILNSIGLIQKIARVEIKGNHKINASAITEKIKSRKDGHYSEADIASDIKTIFKMGLFLDVTAEAASTTGGKVITFIVQEKD
jgi:TolB-like protein